MGRPASVLTRLATQAEYLRRLLADLVPLSTVNM